MIKIQSLQHAPLIGLTYAFAGTCFGLLWLRRAAFRELGGVMLVIAALNGYVEMWPRLRSANFQNGASLLVLVFLWPYSLLSIRLMEGAGVARGQRAFFASQLPIIYLLLLGMVLINLRDIATFDNPPLAMYIFVVLVCVLHVPSFAAGKTRMLEDQTGLRPSSTSAIAFDLPDGIVRRAALALAAPLFIAVLIEGFIIGDDWLLVSLDATLSAALVLLFVISSGRGWKSLGFQKRSPTDSST